MLETVTGIRRIVLCCGYVDLRKGIEGLSLIVGSRFSLNPYEKGTLFLFCGRRSDRIKGLVWESDGYLLLYKRLEQGNFQWPRSESEVRALTPQQFRWLMEGLTIAPKKSVQSVSLPEYME